MEILSHVCRVRVAVYSSLMASQGLALPSLKIAGASDFRFRGLRGRPRHPNEGFAERICGVNFFHTPVLDGRALRDVEDFDVARLKYVM